MIYCVVVIVVIICYLVMIYVKYKTLTKNEYDFQRDIRNCVHNRCNNCIQFYISSLFLN